LEYSYRYAQGLETSKRLFLEITLPGFSISVSSRTFISNPRSAKRTRYPMNYSGDLFILTLNFLMSLMRQKGKRHTERTKRVELNSPEDRED
jgi:hypothetical protein